MAPGFPLLCWGGGGGGVCVGREGVGGGVKRVFEHIPSTPKTFHEE